MRDDIRELTDADFARSIPRRLRDRLMRGELKSGDDIAALRRFTGLSQETFAVALGISVHTLRNWEQGRRMPEGPALALLRIAARHPRVLRENLALAGRSTRRTRGMARSQPQILRLPSAESHGGVRHARGRGRSGAGDILRFARGHVRGLTRRILGA